MNKSNVRIKIEKAVCQAGFSYLLENSSYTDKSKSGWRIKFVTYDKLSNNKIQKIRKL
jgi:hypothetical protein